MPPKTELDIFSPLNKGIEHLKQEAGVTADFNSKSSRRHPPPIPLVLDQLTIISWGGGEETHNSHASLLQTRQIMVNMKIRFAHKHPNQISHTWELDYNGGRCMLGKTTVSHLNIRNPPPTQLALVVHLNARP